MLECGNVEECESMCIVCSVQSGWVNNQKEEREEEALRTEEEVYIGKITIEETSTRAI